MRKRRAIIVVQNEGVVKGLRSFFSSRDYEVTAHAEPGICPLYEDVAAACPLQRPCSDIIITDCNMPRMTAPELFQIQFRRGCRITNRNKALIFEVLDEAIMNKLTALGVAFFHEPLDFQELAPWVVECESRMELDQPLGSRRAEVRHAASLDIQCLVDVTANKVVKGTAVNMSNNGLCVKLPYPLRRRQTVHLDTGLPLIACHIASVQWVHKNGGDTYYAGLRCR